MNQHAHLNRVLDSIGRVIVEFCERRVGMQFRACELREFVNARIPGVAPGSPDRILRELHKRGVVDYVLVSRAGSLYRVMKVNA